MHRKFPGARIEETFFFLNTPWQGTDSKLVHKFIQQVIINPLIIVSFFLILRLLFKKFRKILTFFLGTISFCILLIYVGVVGSTILSSFLVPTSKFYEEHYVDPQKTKISFGKEKKNLIFIAVESLEKTFSNRTFFGQSLIPDIEALDGTRFLAYQDGFATSFTQGSWIATFCGIPSNYYTADFINTAGKHGFKDRLKNIDSLGKILKRNGYSTFYLKGSDGAFSGTRIFMENHGIDEFMDKEKISQLYPHYIQGPWGYEDADLMSILKDALPKSIKHQPFAIFVETVDMHVSNVVENPIPDKFSNPYLNAIYHTNLVVADFVKWFQNQPEYKDTVIIIVGDHTRMGNDFPMPSARSNRYIYNLFINAPKVKNTRRIFSQIDMFPSTLEAMGAKIEGHSLGLGVSIFSNK